MSGCPLWTRAPRAGQVTLQVLPFAAGAPPTVSAGFVLLGFAGLGMPDMAYVEHPLGALHTDKAADVDRATLAFDRLRTLALSPDDSVALIERMAGGIDDPQRADGLRAALQRYEGMTWAQAVDAHCARSK